MNQQIDYINFFIDVELEKEKKKEYHKRYYQKNKEKIKERSRNDYLKKDKEETKLISKIRYECPFFRKYIKDYSKVYYKKNRDKVREYHKRNYLKNKYKNKTIKLFGKLKDNIKKTTKINKDVIISFE